MFELQSNMLLISISLSFIPILVILLFTGIGYNAFKEWLDINFEFPVKIYWYSFFMVVVFGIVSLLFGTSLQDLGNYIVNEARIVSFDSGNDFIPYLFSFQPMMYVIWGLMIGMYLVYRDAIRYNHNSEIIRERKRKEKKLDNYKKVPLNYNKNLFIIGKSGAGKTVAIANFLQSHLVNKKDGKNEFCIIMDGKGDVGKYSLYDIVTKLCKKNGRKLYIINQSLPDQTHAYNPFVKCNATQVKDMLLNMTDWSEEHYKALAGEYFQALAQFMLDVNIDVSFNNLIFYGNKSHFTSTLQEYQDSDEIDENTYLYYEDVINRCGDAAQGSIARFSTLARGIGSQMFRDENAFNLKIAYEERAVVLVLLNKLEYTDFARGVGLLVINDIKNVLGDIAKIPDEHDPFLCVYDEMSVYFCEMILEIVNKSRSLGGTNILSTQTISDLDLIDENIRRSVINNMHGFFLLKQADDKSAEALASAIGTKKATELTSKLDSRGKTGDGTSKIVDEFKIHPNQLKELELGVGYWVDTMKKDYKPIKVRLPYVDVSGIDKYVFTDIGSEK